MPRYFNDSSDGQAVKVASELFKRGQEMLEESRRDDDHDLNMIWNNMSFHVCCVQFRQLGLDLPAGPAAQAYIALVLAALEQGRTKREFDDLVS